MIQDVNVTGHERLAIMRIIAEVCLSNAHGDGSRFFGERHESRVS